MALTLPKQEPIKLVKPKGNERERLVRMRTALVMGSPFYGLLAVKLKLVEEEAIHTAGTDGKRMAYNPSYIAGLTDAQVKGLWGHEVLHCTNGHIWRKGQREHRVWNLACDYAIDPILVNGKMDVPNATINPAWAGWSAEQIYNVLMEEVEEQRKKQREGNGGEGVGFQQMLDIMFGEGPTKGQVLDAPAATAIQDQSEWKEAISAAAQIAKAQGKMPADIELMVENAVKPRVDWKSLTARFAQQAAALDYTWSAPSSRYMPMGLYLPKLRSEKVGKVVFGWDTSGSHFDKKTQEATAAEVVELMRSVLPETVYVAYCDATLQGTPLELDPNDAPKWKPKGGGGTSFKPVFEWVEKEGIEPAFMIYMTDCYGDFPEEAPPYPVLWLSTVEPEKLPASYTPHFGELVYLDLE